MSLNRTVLRWATVSALTHFNEAPYPTLAGRNIYDSRIEPVEGMEEDKIYPLCIIYTDYDTDPMTYKQNSHNERVVTLTFELLCSMVNQDPNTNTEYEIEYPQTDSELEFNLDVFETQIFDALRRDCVAAEAWRSLVLNYDNMISRRGASVEGGKKLAVRQITMECSIPREPLGAVIPEYVQPFLTELETRGSYRERLKVINGAYNRLEEMTEQEFAIHQMGLNNASISALGYDRGPATFNTQPIQWFDQSGQTL